MTGADNRPPVPPTTPDSPATTPDPPRPRRLTLAVVAVTACLAVVAATGLLIVTVSGGRNAPLVLTEPGTVFWGQTVTRPIEIAADRITVRRVVVEAGGTAAIRVRAGIQDTLIEDTEIRCTEGDTDGIVPGGYSALRVKTRGCRQPFRQSVAAPASVVDSAADGRPYALDRIPTGTPATTDFGTGPAAGSGPAPLSQWPGPDTTGVPKGTRLRDSGSLDLRTPGEVVSDLNIVGCVTVRAENVTIRNSSITCDSDTFSIRTYDSATNLLVENVEIDGRGKNSAAVCCANYTLRRVNIHHVIDGPRLSSNTTVTDSWIHDLSRQTESHNDTLQTTGGTNIVVRHNRLEPHRPGTRDPLNACLMIGSTTSDSVANLLVEGNYCNGGNYSIGVRQDLNASNIVIRGNRFGRDFRYGVIARPEQTGITWDRLSNVWLDTGRPVVP